MEQIEVTKDCMASIMLGKNVWFPWRGQKDVVAYVQYEDWIEFVKDNYTIYINHAPVNVNKFLNGSNDFRFRCFMFEISYALFNEVMISGSEAIDGTIILPSFDGVESVKISRVESTIYAMSIDERIKLLNRFNSASPSVRNCPIESLSSHNVKLFLLSLYLQSYAYNGHKFGDCLNIEWR